MTSNIIAASSLVQAIGPQWSSDEATRVIPALLTRPKVGFSPAIPQSADGLRMEPPASVPSAPIHNPAAIAAADPLLDPPVKDSRFQGLREGGKGKSKEGPLMANSCVVCLPRRMAPESRRRSTVLAFVAATLSSSNLEQHVVLIPLTSITSLRPSGIPCRRPR